MEELYAELESLEFGAGEFACSGLLPDLGLPGLHIENVGYISLPVQQEQAQKIIEVAKKAPYGLGENTLVDETVRKTWQLDPNQITITNKHFIAGVKNVVAAVKKHLGCDKKAVEANLYKMLMYEKGGHFKAHRDTEKENGMFATLIVQLPSQFEGGKLTVRHAGKEKVVDFDGEESVFSCRYASFYSDCEHEVSEVTSGYRVALIYSLCWTETGDPPSADTGTAIVENIARFIGEIFDTEDRHFFLWFLSHKYTVSGLSRSGVNALKGADEAVARALLLASERLPEDQRLQFHIVEVTRELTQDGHLDQYGSGEFEADSYCDGEEDLKIETWYKLDGAERKMGHVRFDIEEDVLNFGCPSDMTKEEYLEEFWGEAYNKEYNGPTGNAGATQTYWYRNYAIIVYPKAEFLSIVCQSGYEAAVTYVFDQLKQVQGLASSTTQSHESALSDLKTVINFGISNPVPLYGSVVPTMLQTLVMLCSESSESSTLANLFLSKVMAKESRSPNSCLGNENLVVPLVQLTLAVGWPSISESLRMMFTMSPVYQHSIWAGFLEELYKASKDEEVLREEVIFKSIVTSFVEKLETDLLSGQFVSDGAVRRVQNIASLLFLLVNEELLEKFTTVICAHSHRCPQSCLLQKLVETLAKKELGDDRFWMQLLLRRIHQLEVIEKEGIRPFSWQQEGATVVGHHAVQAFLRGPNRSMRYEAFNNIAHARNWRAKHFYREPSSSYSATVTVGGRGRDAYAVIEKTRAWYDRKVNTIRQQLRELKKLRDVLKPQPDTSTGDSLEDQLEPQTKKRAVEVVCVDDE